MYVCGCVCVCVCVPYPHKNRMHVAQSRSNLKIHYKLLSSALLHLSDEPRKLCLALPAHWQCHRAHFTPNWFPMGWQTRLVQNLRHLFKLVLSVIKAHFSNHVWVAPPCFGYLDQIQNSRSVSFWAQIQSQHALMALHNISNTKYKSLSKKNIFVFFNARMNQQGSMESPKPLFVMTGEPVSKQLLARYISQSKLVLFGDIWPDRYMDILLLWCKYAKKCFVTKCGIFVVNVAKIS